MVISNQSQSGVRRIIVVVLTVVSVSSFVIWLGARANDSVRMVSESDTFAVKQTLRFISYRENLYQLVHGDTYGTLDEVCAPILQSGEEVCRPEHRYLGYQFDVVLGKAASDPSFTVTARSIGLRRVLKHLYPTCLRLDATDGENVRDCSNENTE